MNREIKFKVWTGLTMEYNVTVGKFGNFYVNPGTKGDGLDEKDSASLTPFNTRYLDSIPVMQFTGLRDKNGKDIYEGDIVNFAEKRKICEHCAKKEISSELKYGISRFCPECGKEITDIDFITTSVVCFNEGGFSFEFNNKETYYRTWRTSVAENYLVWKEVIGNIYENPELLTTPQPTT